MKKKKTIVEKLEYLSTTKHLIKEAIVSKGVEVDEATTFREYAQRIESIQSGGGTSEKLDYNDVTIIDYDGTILSSYSFADAPDYNDIPLPPEHELIIFDGWNISKDVYDFYVDDAKKPIIIGALYATIDGCLYYKIKTLYDNHLVSLPYGIASNGTVDWGDGNTQTLIEENAEIYSHTYTKKGTYTIKVDKGIEEFYVYKDNKNTIGYNLICMYFPKDPKFTISLEGNTLETATFSSESVFASVRIFNDCHFLECVVLPPLPENIKYLFRNCIALKVCTLSFTSYSYSHSDYSMFGSAISLNKFFVDINKESPICNYNDFKNNYAMDFNCISHVCRLPNTVEFNNENIINFGTRELHLYNRNIRGISTLSNLYSLEYIYLHYDTVILLGSSSFIPSNVKCIFVPAAYVTSYKTSTNWSSLSSKIKAIPT